MKLHLNLASRTYFNRRALRLAGLLVIGLLGALLVGGLGLVWRSQARWAQLQESLGGARQELETFRRYDPTLSDPARRERLAEEVSRANAILARDSFRWTWLLDRLEALVPRDVSIRMLKPDFEEGTLQLQGWAREVEDLREFLDRLLASPDFNRVYLLGQARQEVGGSGGSLMEFTLVVEGGFRHD